MNFALFISSISILFFLPKFRIWQRLVLYFLVFSILFLCLMFLAGVKINLNSSIPRGIYLSSGSTLQHGEYVNFCPQTLSVVEQAQNKKILPPLGCSEQTFTKKIVALEGDTISISKEGVSVNGNLLPSSRPLRALLDLSRSLDSYRLQKDELLLMGEDEPLSFDGRYFGVIQTSDPDLNVTPLRPLYLFENQKKETLP